MQMVLLIFFWGDGSVFLGCGMLLVRANLSSCATWHEMEASKMENLPHTPLISGQKKRTEERGITNDRK